MHPACEAIGGEIELEVSAWLSGCDASDSWRGQLPKSSVLVSTGRAALCCIVDALRREDASLRTLLLPSYVCGSVIDAIERAGLSVAFYPVATDLRPPSDALVGALASSGAGGILFVNYFGIPCDDELRAALNRLRERVWVIEDCAGGGLLESPAGPIGSTGHFAFTSLRKYLPIPDGAVILNRSGPTLIEPPVEEDRDWIRLRLLGKLARGEHRRLHEPDLATTLEQAYLALFEASEQLLDETGGGLGVSRTSLSYDRLDLAAVARRRRENFEHLLERVDERVGSGRQVRSLIGSLPIGASPLVFPVTCLDQAYLDGLRGHLASRRIFCPVHWPLPPRVAESFPEAASLSSRILAFPVDQRYGAIEMDRILDAVTDYLREAAR